MRVLDGAGQKVCAARCVPTRESLLAMEARALAGTPEGTRLEVILEPTGAAWFPVARFLAARGHAVYRVSSAKAADLRKRQPEQGRNRAPGLCVQLIIMRQLSKMLSKIVTLPYRASCKQAPVSSLRANPGVVLPLRADLDGGGRRRR